MPRIKVIEGFIEPEDCKLAIELISKSDLIPFKTNQAASVAPRNQEITALLKKYSDKCLELHKEWHKLQVPIYTFEAFLTLWGVGASAGVHIDNHVGAENVQLSSVLYFNDEFEGGEIYFPEFNFVHKPKAGDGIFFPAFTKDANYEHGVTEVTNGKRYTMGLWHTQFENLADKELL
jgi:predicted 2-oxoglutarate/Fe(II)-dependent dioxygenase YbiX